MAKAGHLLLLRCRFSTTKPNPKPYLPPFASPSISPPPPPPPPPPSSQPQPHQTHSCTDDTPDHLRHRIRLLTEKPTLLTPSGDLLARVSSLAEEILRVSDVRDVVRVLESRSAVDLLRQSPNRFASVELLFRLKAKPHLAMEVFNWRRRQADARIPMVAEEYSKAIAIAGRTKNVDLALSLFHDANEILGIRSTCIYNALMTTYRYNGLTSKAISVFEEMKNSTDCKPTIITYNIILSVFGRSLLIKQMESVLEIIDKSDDLSPDLTTYNTIISGYITAWMFDWMEGIFNRMETGPVKPDVSTHLLMLRGYAYSGNIEKMERTYELVKETVNNYNGYLIRAMICAYCKSSDSNRVRKVESLMKFIPSEDYRAWLNVSLIRLYAQEGLVDSMDRLILEAFNRKTLVTTSGIMRAIISSYFNCGAVDLLVGFIRNAEYAGWRLSRSLYHCSMVMYGQQNRLKEMHEVLDEMEAYKLNPTKKTFWIMYKAYLSTGRMYEAESIVGLMWKNGFLGTNKLFTFYNTIFEIVGKQVNCKLELVMP